MEVQAVAEDMEDEEGVAQGRRLAVRPTQLVSTRLTWEVEVVVRALAQAVASSG